MPPCALIGIYLSTSESSVDLSSQCSSELGIDVISATQIKNRAWRLNSTLCCFKETQSPESGCCSQRLRWFLLTPHTCFLLGQQETTFGSSYTLSFISQPHTSRVLLLQPAGEKPGAVSYCWSAYEREHQLPTSQPAWPKSSPSVLLPIHRWLMRWSLPAAQHHHSAASQISWTTLKQIYLSCNYSAKTSKEQSWGPTVTPQILAVSPLSSSLYIFVPTFHLGLPLFSISGQIITPTEEQQTAAWLSACPWWIKASPHSLLSHSFQHHFITGKAEKPVAAVFLF